MWQRFTERARRVVFFAQEEAGRLGENYVSTEHLLLGLIRENDSFAMRVLDRMGVSPKKIRSEVEKQVTRGEGRLGQDMQLTPRAKRVIDLAYDEARNLMNNYIGTEHLLLGLVREGEGVAGRVLSKMGVTLDEVRRIVREMQGTGEAGETPGERIVRAPRTWKTEAMEEMSGKDLIEIACLSRGEIDAIFDLASRIKGDAGTARDWRVLGGKTMAMIFEKPSLRTRVSFEVGMTQLGGHAIYLAPADVQLGKRETIADAAHNLERMCDIIMARTFAHQTVTELAEHSRVPVINGLSDLEHPCQALADFLTIIEKKGALGALKLAFIGDGNNVAHSLMLLAAKVGTSFAIACPEGYDPLEEIVCAAQSFAKETGATMEIVRDAAKAVKEADVVYTDVWASMGQEDEAEERAKVFAPYQVNAKLMKKAKPDAIFMHCLPAHRGLEVTDEVIDSEQSVVFDQAENRLHAQKAVMALLAG